MISNPKSTPMVDITTADSTSQTEVKRLNCASSTTKIRNIAAPNALVRNAPAAACSSSSPASFQRMPMSSNPAADSSAVIASRTGAA